MQLRMLATAAFVSALVACGGGGDAGNPGASNQLSITATATTAVVASGTIVPVDVVITASGPDPATHVSASLKLGTGLSRGTVTCSASGGAICPTDPPALSVASLPANGSLHFQINVFIAPGASGAILSSASVAADNQAASATSAAPWVVSVYSADVSVSGTGPSAQLSVGDTANYTMAVANAGPDAASGVVIENVVDADQALSLVTCVPSGGATCPTSLGARMTVPTLPSGGGLTFSISAIVAASAFGFVTDKMYASQFGDPLTGNNAATASAVVALPATPGTVSYVSLQGDMGDYISLGRSYFYKQANAVFSATVSGGHLTFNVAGDESWRSDFQVPNTLSQLQPGTYPNLQRYPFNDPAVGGLSWSGEGRGCNALQGSFSIDNVMYVHGTLTAIDLRLEQHCEGAAPALLGQIHWVASDTSRPPDPVNVPPTLLWRAPAGATPSAGNYVYLQGDGGGATSAPGLNALYTQASALLTMNASGGHLGISVNGNDRWNGDVQAMNTLSQLQPGYYADLKRFPFHNPTRGGLDWSGTGRGCNTETGWFVIDSITYTGGALSSVDLRFEQHCEGDVSALHGQIHWAPGDTTAPPGPLSLPPAGLWDPPSGATPISGNYVYLQSDNGDYIGQGLSHLYTPASDTISVTGSGGLATVTVNGQGGWSGNFLAMNSISQLQPGYYGGLLRWPFNNPTTGGLNWSGYGSGCNRLTGWFVIDSISYVNGALSSIDLRFEQHCEGAVPALHGKIHWARS